MYRKKVEKKKEKRKKVERIYGLVSMFLGIQWILEHYSPQIREDYCKYYLSV
jgi:hypothetical protein